MRGVPPYARMASRSAGVMGKADGIESSEFEFSGKGTCGVLRALAFQAAGVIGADHGPLAVQDEYAGFHAALSSAIKPPP